MRSLISILCVTLPVVLIRATVDAAMLFLALRLLEAYDGFMWEAHSAASESGLDLDHAWSNAHILPRLACLHP